MSDETEKIVERRRNEEADADRLVERRKEDEPDFEAHRLEEGKERMEERNVERMEE